ncbi:AAA family ATPase [Patulibacter defluvii]|uniref:AAA family ATPase n=1 Tax=Patulibacter defluvii TaxID=3095358 RepID=UPI002A759964|nr:AAA family ATPase [Patulibacter sp. DM4]
MADPPSGSAAPAPDGSTLLGRGPELARIDAALDRMLDGVVGRLLVVEGPAGAGCTSLLDAAAARARARQVPVLRAVADERSRDVPFGVAVDLFDDPLRAADPARRAALLADRAALAAPLFAPDGGPGPVEADGAGLVEGLYWLAGQIARFDPEHRPAGLLIAIDDAHWCDHATLRVLARMALRIAQLPLVAVLGVREDLTGDDLLERLRHHPRAERLRPAPLDRAAVAVLAGERLGAAADERLVAACVRATGGNPFLVHEFLAAVADGSPTPTPTPDPAADVAEAAARAVALRLAAVDPDARRLARATAILGDGARLRQAAALADLSIDRAEAAADALAAAGLLQAGEPLRFGDGLVRAAAEAQVPAAERARGHRRAAAILQGEGAPVARVASHLLQAPAAGDAQVVTALRRAAAEAREQDEPGVAVRALRRALAEPPTADERRAVLVELATAEAAAGEPDGDARLEDAIAATPDPRARAALLLALARLRAGRGAPEAAIFAATQARALLDPAPLGRDPLVDGLLSVELDAMALRPSRWPVRQERADAACADLVAGAAPPADDPILGAQLAVEAALRGQPIDRVVALARAAVADSPLVDPRHGEGFGLVAQALLHVDQAELAVALAEDAIAEARTRGAPVAFAVASGWRAAAHYRRGDLVAAIADAEAALELHPEASAVVALLARLRMERAETDAAALLLERVAGSGPDDPGHGEVLLARAALATARGEGAAAIDALLTAGRHLVARYGSARPTLGAWWSWAALLAARIGRDDDARAWAAEGLRVATAAGLPGWTGLALRARAAHESPAERVATLRAAVALLDRSPARLEHARAQIDLGVALLAEGERTAALTMLSTALDAADRCGATATVERARVELAASGVTVPPATPRGARALTPAERRVAERAAAGQTNLQIAQDLFVTTKTVEGHLRNVYRKLAVDSRRALAPILAEASDGGTTGRGVRARARS